MPHLWPTGSSWGRPLDYGPVLLRKPFGPHLTVGALSSAVPSWRLQVHLGCVRLSPACPCRCLHTCHLRPARHYPRLWIRPPSSGGRRDFNPPDQCAAWRTLRASPPPSPARPDPHGLSVGTVPRRRQGFPVLRPFPSSMRAAANTPAEPAGASVARFPARGSLPRIVGGSASAFDVSRPARRSLALRPAWSLSRPMATRVVGVLQAMSLPPSSAPTATGWNDSCRAGFAPAEEWRLRTAHHNDVVHPLLTPALR